MILFLFVVIIAIALGIVGAVVHGLLYLLIIGIVVLVADVAFLAMRRRTAQRPHR